MRAAFLRVVPALLLSFASFGPVATFAQNSNPPAPGDSTAAGTTADTTGADASRPRHVGGGVLPPKVLRSVFPQFSDEARKEKFGGTVTVNLWVDEQGNPTHVRVLHGIGMGLDEKAIEAIKQYKFAPATEGGKPVTVELNIQINFAISDKPAAGTPAGYVGTSPTASSQATPTAAGSPCGAGHPVSLGAADTALAQKRYPEAERLYTEALAADPASGAAMAGLVRTALAQDKLPEALTLATRYDTGHPSDPAILDALGEVRFRRGEVDEAAMAFNKSVNLNPCSGPTHYDMARFLDLSGLHASAQRQIEMAHTLAPQDQQIEARWRTTHAVPLTPEQRLARLQQQLARPTLTGEQHDAIAAAINAAQTREKGSCELVTPVKDVKLPMIGIPDSVGMENISEAGLEVQINGKKRRLEIDTGASGMVLSSAVAKRAGLVPELQVKAAGVGDTGPASAFVTHVDDIKIGAMEFKNCMVQVLQGTSVLDAMPDVDGLIGPDVFKDYVVTLDYPGREVRLGPLPPRPGEQAATFSLATSDSDTGDTPLSIADRARDRYIAPEMKDWTPVFRFGHMLIVPTQIGKAPTKLFLMDTGASQNLISPAAAREVTQLSGFTNQTIKGISGKVQDVLVADKVNITFGRISQTVGHMASIDTTTLTRNVGVDISGLVGFTTLRELILSIDYRDSLIHLTYDPKKGYHAHS